MKLFFILAIIFLYILVIRCVHLKFNQNSSKTMRVKTINGMVVVRQRSLQALVAQESNSTKLEKIYNVIYSEWSPWSKCRKKCKQVRTRFCKSASICQNTILKEERSCTGDRCLSKNKPSHPDSDNSKNHYLENNRGRGRTNGFRVLYHLQSFIYSPWSKWSPCTENCQTRRHRTCVMEEICSNNTIREDAICYFPGSNCEKYFNSKSQELSDQDRNSYTPKIYNNGSIDDEMCGNTHRNDITTVLRIIGGREANKGRWPWIVAILNRNKEAFCGGTLVSPQFILTAAHCVRRRLYVRAGEHDLMLPEGSEQTQLVTEVFVHPEYDADTVDNDIALLKLRTPFQINRYTSPICLPSPNDVLPVNSLARILGWGKRRNSAMFGSDVLHEAQVPIADLEDCRSVYKGKYVITENMVCAGYKRGKVDSCAGDSGGPLLFSKRTENSEKWFLYGITSFGEGCGKKNKYGIYAKVPNVVQWIRKTIRTTE